MSQFQPDGIALLIYRNGKWGPGGTKEQVTAFLDTAIAVCLAESGGNDQAIGAKNSNGSTDYGLWQINDKAHADLFKKYTWNNPGDNTEMARQVWSNAGNSFHPWSTFTSGAYKKYLGHGAQAYATLQNAPKNLGNDAASKLLDPSTYAQGAGDTVKQAGKDASSVSGIVGGALSDVMKWIGKGFVVIGASLLALVLFALGVWLLISETKTGKAVSDAAKDTATKAAMAAAV